MQAYLAMFCFLDTLWALHKDQFNWEFPNLLGGMTILEDGSPADAAVWEVWEINLHGKSSLTADEAFSAMLEFLSLNRNMSDSDEIVRVLEMINSTLSTSRTSWFTCVQAVKTTKDP